ncbi:uncharacterized protein LOC133723115 [Rosa rugosa]|uniref:uncharacterized protein LOC133723115 n=1 Tax=Rosa rugosa TaxID=74645 RepID=UPI002B407CC5|nr:uncharacterized protein LOC133723115 [Rosa rugosa]
MAHEQEARIHESEMMVSRDSQGKGKAVARSSSLMSHQERARSPEAGYALHVDVQAGHFARECTQSQDGGQGTQLRQLPSGQARVFAISQRGTRVECTLSVFNYLARVLFDMGATHSFISSSVIDGLGLTPMHLARSLCVTSPLGVSLELSMICDACPIVICGREFSAVLIVIPDHTYDVILGVDWLRPNHAMIDYFELVVSFHIPGQPMFRYRCLRSDTAIRAGVLADIESVNSAIIIAQILVVYEYIDVFQEILGLPPRRIVEFAIDVIPATACIKSTLSDDTN